MIGNLMASVGISRCVAELVPVIATKLAILSDHNDRDAVLSLPKSTREFFLWLAAKEQWEFIVLLFTGPLKHQTRDAVCRCRHLFRESGLFNLVPSDYKIWTILKLDAKRVWTYWDCFQCFGLEDRQAGRPPCRYHITTGGGRNFTGVADTETYQYLLPSDTRQNDPDALIEIEDEEPDAVPIPV
jgi:hypothetical protein